MNEKQVEDYKMIRNKVFDFFGRVPNISKLMKDKVDPFILLEEQPLPIQIGNKIIWVGNLTLKMEDKFFRGYAKILSNFGLQHLFIDLLKNGLALWQHIQIYNKLQKQIVKLIYDIILPSQKWYCEGNSQIYRLSKCSYRYFKEHITKESLLQICQLIYTYNYDVVKKNLSILAKGAGVQEMAGTYMYDWLINLSGLTGSFLTAQLPKLDYWQNESESEIIE
jgi:hypothetical protein